MSTKKRGRPYATENIQQRFKDTERTLEELSSVSMNMCLTLVQALRAARSQLAEMCKHMTAPEPAETSMVACAFQLDQVAAWYREHDDQDRADLLMQPESLQMEYDRFILWMPAVMQQLWGMMIRVWPGRASDPAHPNHSLWKRKLRLKVHLVAAKILRTRSEKCIPLILISKALDRFYQHVRAGTHQQDVKTGDDLHHGVISRLRSHLTHWVPRTPYTVMRRIRLMYLDNWDMYCGQAHNRRKGGEVQKSQMLHAILLAEELMDESLFTGPAPRGSLWADASSWDIMKSIPSKVQVDDHLANFFIGFTYMARDDIKSLWERPAPSCDHQPGGKSVMVSWPAQTHLKANSKEDMAEVYQWLDEEMPGVHKVVLEDWATFAITWNLMFRSPDVYKSWMVWGGELHRQMHTNDAIIHVYWEHVMKPCAMLLFRNEVKLKFDANEFNNKEQFVRLIAVAGFKWLVGLGVPEHVLTSPIALLEAIEGNLPAHEFLHFLLYGGTFALADKSAMRTANSEELNWAWLYTTILGRACNKRNYAKYGIMMDKVINDSHPWVKILMEKYRTFRVTDRPCTGVGKETGIEQVSLLFDTVLHT
jgi:hypothetical protein